MNEPYPDTDRKQEIRRTELRKVYGDMRFKQLTLLMAWLGLVGAKVLGTPCSNASDSSYRVLISCVSMLVTGVLWVMEVRSTLYGRTFSGIRRRTLSELDWTFWRHLSATNSVAFLYAAIYALWWWLALDWRRAPVVAVVMAVLWCILTVYTVVNYTRAIPAAALPEGK